MERVTVSRTIDADPEAVRELVEDVEAFMIGADFDGVSLDGDRLTLQNTVGLFEVELDLRIVESDGVLAYEQVDGVFDSMRTEYHLEPVEGGTEITATTTFEAVDLPVVGKVLDATVVKRQRRKELDAQFDWLERETS